eukprot:GHVH01009523.1.p2 GENE.GHVH01009523.1~~GHVH01009523.1.p2  ORF type:complete len:134 (+),score=10.43 GHVH01009523.1:153-554(+)
MMVPRYPSRLPCWLSLGVVDMRMLFFRRISVILVMFSDISCLVLKDHTALSLYDDVAPNNDHHADAGDIFPPASNGCFELTTDVSDAIYHNVFVSKMRLSVAYETVDGLRLVKMIRVDDTEETQRLTDLVSKD